MLCEDGGETVLRPGDAAGWKAGVANGHCLVNRGTTDAVYLEIGSRALNEYVDYPDIDMRLERIGKDARLSAQVGGPLSRLGAVGDVGVIVRQSTPRSSSPGLSRRPR